MQKLKIQELEKVESSNLAQIGFDKDKTFILFTNGKLYEYPNTTKEEYLGLLNADSVGKQFFKSFKKKEEFTLLENTVLEKIDVLGAKKPLVEILSDSINRHKKAGQGAEAGVLVMFKAALIENTKAKKPLDENVVATKYFKSLQKQQEEYLKAGADTQLIAFEMSVVEKYTPKVPKKLADEEVKKAVTTYLGSKGFTQKDTGAIIRVMRAALGDQNGGAIAKFVREGLNG